MADIDDPFPTMPPARASSHTVEENGASRGEDGDQSVAPESSSATIASDATDPTGPSDRKRNGGRRPKVLPPPPIAVSTIAGGVALASDDLKALAAEIGLNIVVGSDQLENHATSIHEALHSYVLWSRGDEGGSSPAQVEAWAQNISRVVDESIVLFGGNTGEGSPAWGDQTAIRSALSYLLRAWPIQESENESERNDWKRLETLMRMLAPQAKPADMPSYDRMRELLVGLLHGLGVLAVLAPRIRDWAGTLPRTRTPDTAQVILFRRLRHAFEAIYGSRYAVSNRFIGGGPGERGSEPSGVALNWTRALFKLMAARAAELPREVDQFQEFGELAKWAMKTDALAERIKESSRQ